MQVIHIRDMLLDAVTRALDPSAAVVVADSKEEAASMAKDVTSSRVMGFTMTDFTSLVTSLNR